MTGGGGSQTASDGGHPARIGLVTVLTLQALLQLRLARDLTFRLDEWWVITHRLSSPDAPSLLEPHNSHPTMLPLLVYRVLLETAGLRYLPFVLVLVALQAAMGALLYWVLRPRVGSGLAVAAVAMQACTGLAAESQLWAGIMTQTASLVALLVALLLLDRQRSPGVDAGLAAALLVSLACSGFGVVAVVVVGVELLAGGAIRRAVTVLAVPVGALVIWSLTFGDSQSHSNGLGASVRWAVEAVGAVGGAMVGTRELPVGMLVLAAVFVLLVAAARRLPSARRPRVLALLAGGAAFYGMAAVARSAIAPPGSSRYLTAGVLLLLLLVGELLAELDRPAWTPAAAWALIVLGLLNGNVESWRDTQADYLRTSDLACASLTAFDLVGASHVPADTVFAPEAMPLIEAGAWADARSAFDGNPAWSTGALTRRSPAEREQADRVLERLRGVQLLPADAVPTGCHRDGGPTEVPTTGLAVVADGNEPVEVVVRRFGPIGSSVALGEVVAGSSGVIEIVPDVSSVPYIVEVIGPGAICATG